MKIKFNCDCGHPTKVVGAANIDRSTWEKGRKLKYQRWVKLKAPSAYRIKLICTSGTCKKVHTFTGRNKSEVLARIHKQAELQPQEPLKG